MSQLLLTYFKQLHGEQSFSEIFFRMPLITDSKINLNDILQKDFIISDHDMKYVFPRKILSFESLNLSLNSLPLIKNDLDFLRRAIQLPVIEPLDENRLNKFVTMVLNSVLIALKYVRLSIKTDETITNDQILHDIARICIKFGDIIRYSPRLENSRNIFLNYHLLLAVILTKGIQQINPKQSNETQQQQPSKM